MVQNKTLNLYDKEFVKWTHNGKQYCLLAQSDDMPWDPRSWDPVTIMACFSSRYNLGDKYAVNRGEDPDDFWHRIVRENVSEKEILGAAKEGKLEGIRVAQNPESPNLMDVYEFVAIRTVVGTSPASEQLEYEGIVEEAVVDYIMDDLTIGHCMTLLEPYMECLPLWLYDHSGISMSCGTRTYPYNDQWDSGQVGWIIAMKNTIMQELVDIVKDDGGNPVMIEHKHDGQPSTYSYKTVPLTDDTWRARAIEVMQSDVEVYDQFLTGDTWWYKLYERESDEDEWDEIDSVSGFFGADILTNGIVEHVHSYGLSDAIANGEYQEGAATVRTYTVTEIDF